MGSNFYSDNELSKFGFKSFGNNVLLSKKASIYNAGQIVLGNNVRIDDFCILSGNINIGNYIHIAAYSALYGASAGIDIGDYANISSRVCVYAICDDFSGNSMTNPMVPDKYKNVSHGHVKIDKYVIVGSTSVIMPGCHLNEGSAFGAFSFVNKDTSPWKIYAGIPCRLVKDRSRKLLNLSKDIKTI